MSQTYYALLTAIGEAKLANAAALNTTLKIAKMAVGDGGGTVPTPTRTQTALVNEWYRAGLNTLQVDPSNTSQIIAELVIPEATGGNWIREMGLIDVDGNLIAVANTPPSYKPQLAEGSGRTQVLRMVLIVSSTSAVELKIDPSVILATRQYVDDAITVAVNRLDNKQSVRVATTASISLAGTPTVDGIALAVGDRILVKNQDTASQNGLYLVAAGTWTRALDADANSEVTPGLTVYVEQGTTQADTLWKLITDAPITLGATALAFSDITSGYAPLRSPAFIDRPTAPTPPRFDNSQQVANTESLRQAARNFGGVTRLREASVLDFTYSGRCILLEGSAAYAVTLPEATAAAVGAVISFVATNPAGITVSVPNGILSGPGGTALATPSVLRTGDTLDVMVRAAGDWCIVGGSLAAVDSTALLRRTRGIAASISAGGTPPANKPFARPQNFPAFVAPCDGLVIAISCLNVGTATNSDAVINLCRITASGGGSAQSQDGTLGPMSNIVVLPVSRGETVNVVTMFSAESSSTAWQSMSHQSAFWFIPSNSLAV